MLLVLLVAAPRSPATAPGRAGAHASSGRALSVAGWEEWDLNAEGRIAASRGWFDAEDYARQAEAT